MKLKVKKLHPEAIIPKYATDGSACFDLHACFGEPGLSKPIFVTPIAIIKTGLSFEIPLGYVMLVFSRSGHGFKNDVRLANCTGIIDSDYRGELMVKLTHDDTHNVFKSIIDDPMKISHGDRIAQAMIIPLEQVQFEEVEKLSDTERGTGGFGSTGQ